MTETQKRKLPGLPIAVIVIVLVWVGMMYWPSQTDPGVPAEPSPPEPPVVVSTEPTPAETPTTPPPPPVSIPGVPVAQGTAPWSTYHGGAALRGAVNVVLPDAPTRLWRFQTVGSVYQTPVADGQGIYFTTDEGGVIALDLNGEKLWSKKLMREPSANGEPRSERLDAPVACFESTVLVGADSGILYAFDAATGDEKWTYDVGGSILGTVNFQPASLTVPSDRLFILGQSDGTLHAVDLKTGNQIWQTESIDQCDGSPGVGQNSIVFGSCAAALHVFSTADGELIRNIEIDDDSQVAGGVAIVGDSVFSGSRSGKLIHANASTGETYWINEDCQDEIFTTPAVDDAWVVFAAYDGIVYALDRATGTNQWTFDTDGGLPYSPVIAGDKVIVSADGTLYFLRLKSGEKLWSYEVSDEISSPAIINQMVVVGGEDGTVTAFGSPER